MKKVLLFVTGFIGAWLIVSAINSHSHPPTSTETITTLESVDPIATTSNQAEPLASKGGSNAKRIHTVKPVGNRVLLLWGQVGETSLGLAEEIKQLGAESKAPIYLLINSPGGSVLDGALIISAIEASPAPVHTVCMQLCASMAAVIHQYGKERMMTDRAILMFHNAAGGTQGYVPQMLSRLNLINRYVNKMNAFIAARAGVNLTDWAARMDNEVWIDAEDATASHLNDKIVNILMPRVEPQQLQLQENKSKSKINLNWE
jgi:ATP-dependent Clp protease protease subunit